MKKRPSEPLPKPWQKLTFDWNNGQGLEDARKARNMSQEELAKLSGMARSTISLYEVDPSKPHHAIPEPFSLECLEGALEVTFTNVVRDVLHKGTINDHPTKRR